MMFQSSDPSPIRVADLPSLKPTTSNVATVRALLASGAATTSEDIAAYQEWLDFAESDGQRDLLRLGRLKHEQNQEAFDAGVRTAMRCREAMRGQLQVQRDRDVRVRVVEGFVASEDQSALLALQNLRDSLYGSVKACALFPPPSDNPVRMLARGHFTKVATKFCRRDNVQRRTTRHNVRVEENPHVEIALLRIRSIPTSSVVDCFLFPAT